jgi:hypothetical protein
MSVIKILRKMFWSDWTPSKVIFHIPDKIKLFNGSQRLKLRKIQKWKRRMNIERNYYKNFEED